MAEENKKSGLIKKVLKTAALIGAGTVIGIAIAKPEETKNVWNKLAGFCGGLFKKKTTAEPCVDADLSDATNNDVRSNNNGWNNNRPKFNNNKKL